MTLSFLRLGHIQKYAKKGHYAKSETEKIKETSIRNCKDISFAGNDQQLSSFILSAIRQKLLHVNKHIISKMKEIIF